MLITRKYSGVTTVSQKSGEPSRARAAAALESQGSLGHSPVERKRVHQRGAAHARRRHNLIQQLTVEGEAAGFITAERLAGRDPRRHHMFGSEAGVHLRQRMETADEQARGDDQQNGEGDFGDDERAAQTLRHRESRAAPAAPQRFGERRARRLKRRGQSEGQARDGDEDRR